MATLHHQLWINAPVSKIYAALATAEGLGQWWAPHTATETPEGQVLSHDPGPQHGKVEFVVLEDAPFSRVEWQVISSHPERSPAYGWMGTPSASRSPSRRTPVPGVASAILPLSWQCLNSATPAGTKTASSSAFATSHGVRRSPC